MVANPVGVHPEMIRPGVDGFLASTPDEWVEAVRRLAGRPRPPARMGRAARASLEANYSVEAWAPAFVAAVAGAGRWPSLDADAGAVAPGRAGDGRPDLDGAASCIPPSQQSLAPS